MLEIAKGVLCPYSALRINQPPDPLRQIRISSICSWMKQKIFAFAAFDGSFLSSQRAYFLRSPHQLTRWRIPK